MGALHLAILLFGAAGLLGRELSLNPVAITAGRAGIAALLLWVLLLRRRRDTVIHMPGLAWIAGSGALLALHWSCFFAAVRLGGVPVALLGYASFPAFGLLLDQLESRRTRRPRPPIQARQWLALGLLACGLALLVPWTSAASSGHLRQWGLVAALAAGASFALLTRINAAKVKAWGALPLAAAQMTGAALWLLPLAGGELLDATARDWLLLLALGLACTALAHSLFIRALKRVTPFQAGIAAGLEPVYGILLAALLPGATPLPREWAALPLIVAAALLTMRSQQDPPLMERPGDA